MTTNVVREVGGLDFVVLNVMSGMKEHHLAIVSWRNFVLVAVAAMSAASGTSTSLAGCCLGWFGGGWGANYAEPYSAGYFPGGGYGHVGYAPAYGPSYGGGGCSNCGSSYASGYGSGGYSQSAPGCSSCVGSGCGVTTPTPAPGEPVRPTPEDGFRAVPPNSPLNNPAPADPYPPTDRPSRPPRRTYDPADEPGAAPAGPGRTVPPRRNEGIDRRNDGIDNSRGNRGTEPESTPSTGDDTFDRPLRPRGNPGPDDGADPFNAKRVPMPEAGETTPAPRTPPAKPAEVPAVPDDSFGGDNAGETKTNRPVLGEPVPADAELVTPKTDDKSIIPSRKPAPVESTPEEEALPEPELPQDLNLDNAATTSGVAPKSRLALAGRFSTPTIVRLKLRPTTRWYAEPLPPVIARN